MRGKEEEGRPIKREKKQQESRCSQGNALGPTFGELLVVPISLGRVTKSDYLLVGQEDIKLK